MKKTAKISMSICLIFFVGAITFVLLSDKLMAKEDTPLQEALVLEDTSSEKMNQENSTEETSEEEIVITTESEFMEVIHHMAHQKVEASPKWGAIEINEKRIDDMLKVLETNELSYEEFYSDTLAEWKKGDFSNAVDVHNKVWKMQKGTIGEATGLLSPEEEQEYIEENFK